MPLVSLLFRSEGGIETHRGLSECSPVLFGGSGSRGLVSNVLSADCWRCSLCVRACGACAVCVACVLAVLSGAGGRCRGRAGAEVEQVPRLSLGLCLFAMCG